MAEQQATLAAPFPAPPPFYKHFTKQNTSRLRQLRKHADATQSTELDRSSLPAELHYLIPPSLPADGKYRTFGVDIDLQAPDATLAAAGIEQLYPSDASVALNPQPHLLALTRSLLTTFLSLAGILAENPTEYYAERVEGLQTIMYNVHDLINQYRPHQARESLLFMMEERIERMRDEIQRIYQAKSKVDDLLKELEKARDDRVLDRGRPSAQHGNIAEASPAAQRDGTPDDRQRRAWAAMEQAAAEVT